MKKLPLGIQNFETPITRNCVYVDKTRYIYQMATAGMFYFLPRPRRFGKSLLVSTLKALFEGRKKLFKAEKPGKIPCLRFFNFDEALDFPPGFIYIEL